MATDLLGLLVDLREDRNSQAAQEEMYLLVRESLLDPLQRRVTGSLQPRLDAEDILHDAYLRVLGGISAVEFPSQKAFLGWVWRIARNLMIDQAKRRSAAAFRLDAGASDRGVEAQEVLSRKKRVESTVCRADWIESILLRMKLREAEVIRLRWIRALSYEEIGREWKKTPVAVKRLYARAWKTFREFARKDTSFS